MDFENDPIASPQSSLDHVTDGEQLFVPQENSDNPQISGGRTVVPASDASEDDEVVEPGLPISNPSVIVPPVDRPWEYQVYDEPYGGLRVVKILREEDDDDGISYLVRFEDGSEETVRPSLLSSLPTTLIHFRAFIDKLFFLFTHQLRG